MKGRGSENTIRTIKSSKSNACCTGLSLGSLGTQTQSCSKVGPYSINLSHSCHQLPVVCLALD